MNAVGIDVSKGKSMVAAINISKEVMLSPREFEHTEAGIEQLVCSYLLTLNGEVRVIMEATGRYHEPITVALHEAGIYVSVVNPILIHGYSNNSVRRVKTDRKDALKIARYGIDNWAELREYTPLDTMRQQLKLMSRQYNFYMKHVVQLQNNHVRFIKLPYFDIRSRCAILQGFCLTQEMEVKSKIFDKVIKLPLLREKKVN